MVRKSYTVYCETCQRNFYSYVLGRGPVKFNRKQAEERATNHRFLRHGHVVTVKEKA